MICYIEQVKGLPFKVREQYLKPFSQVLLSAVALAFASPIPDGDEAPAALPYVHDATGDVAVDDSPAALPYVHDATGDVADDASPAAEPYVHDATGDVAVAYVHEEPVVVAPVAVAAPAVTYAAYPYTYGAYPYLAAGAVVPKVEVKAAEAPAAVAPVTYAAYPYHHAYPYAVAAYHTGCVNNVGSVVPCA